MPFILLKRGKFIRIANDANSCSPSVKALNSASDAGEKARLKGELLAAGALLGVLQQNPADWFADQTKAVDGAQIEALIADRNAARKARDFKEADRLRTAIAAIGVVIEDRPDGTTKWRMAE